MLNVLQAEAHPRGLGAVGLAAGGGGPGGGGGSYDAARLPPGGTSASKVPTDVAACFGAALPTGRSTLRAAKSAGSDRALVTRGAPLGGGGGARGGFAPAPRNDSCARARNLANGLSAFCLRGRGLCRAPLSGVVCLREKLARGGEGVAVRRTFGTVGGEPLRLSVKEGDGVARAADAAVGRATSRRGFGCFTGGGGFAGSTGEGGTGGGASSNGVFNLSMTTSAGRRGSKYLVSKGGLSRAFGMPA